MSATELSSGGPAALRHALRVSGTLEKLDDCVHCGLCLPKCPTYAQLGDENDSPRGRLQLMRGLAERRLEPGERIMLHLDRCLDCRACETACPSGVQYAAVLGAVRAIQPPSRRANRTLWGRVLDRVIYNVMPDVRRLRRAMGLARCARAIGLPAFLRETGLMRRLPAALERLEAMLPDVTLAPAPLPEVARPRGDIRARVGLFAGCVGEAVFAETNRATHRVLLANGCEVHCPPAQGCCGAIHHHGGRSAADWLRRNLDAFEAAESGGPLDAIVVNVAGCGAMLKQADAVLAADGAYADRAARFAARVRDVSEFLVSLPMRAPTGRLDLCVAYHPPCHLLHAQRVSRQPIEMLSCIPGVRVKSLPEADLCCGAAGTYNLTQPGIATDLAERKLCNVDRVGGVDAIATGNAGCILHLAGRVRETARQYSVVHPIELLDLAYRGREQASSPA